MRTLANNKLSYLPKPKMSLERSKGSASRSPEDLKNSGGPLEDHFIEIAGFESPKTLRKLGAAQNALMLHALRRTATCLANSFIKADNHDKLNATHLAESQNKFKGTLHVRLHAKSSSKCWQRPSRDQKMRQCTLKRLKTYASHPGIQSESESKQPNIILGIVSSAQKESMLKSAHV